MALAAADLRFEDVALGLRAVSGDRDPSPNIGKRPFYPPFQDHMFAGVRPD
jgi:hypothetical protein